MAVSKKDFEAIAAAIKSVSDSMDCDPSAVDAISAVANAIAVEFKHANPRFDRARFLAACGVEA